MILYFVPTHFYIIENNSTIGSRSNERFADFNNRTTFAGRKIKKPNKPRHEQDKCYRFEAFQ